MKIERIDVVKENIDKLFDRFKGFKFANPYHEFYSALINSDYVFTGDFGFIRLDRVVKGKCAFIHGMFDGGSIWRYAKSADWYIDRILMEAEVNELYAQVPSNLKGLSRLIEAFHFYRVCALQTKRNSDIMIETLYVYKKGGLDYVKR